MARRRDWPTWLESVPTIAFGSPVIHGTGIPIAAVASRWLAGECISALAKDYGLDDVVVEYALQDWMTRPRDWRMRLKPHGASQ